MQKTNINCDLAISSNSADCLSSSSSSNYELSDTFYTSQKKGHVFRVSLNANGFTLQRESSNGSKDQTVRITDIVGGRCMRLKKTRRLANACACSSSSNSSSTNATATTASTANVSIASNNNQAILKGCSNDGSRGNIKDGNVLTYDDDGDVSAYLYVFAYVLKKGLRNNLHRERTVLTLRFRSFDTFEDNMHEADRWYRALCWQVNQTLEDIFYVPEDERRRRILILLNPKSGSGKAREMFNMQMTPVLNEAEVPYDLHVTKHSNYASDFVRIRNLDIWSTIIAVGGDGLFHEVLNGLLQRKDWQTVLEHTALGIVPCGSGNGLARSIAYSYKEPYASKPILSSVLTAISGRTAAMDVVRVELKNHTVYSFLSIGWGLISDIDIESERLRMLGYQRFTLWTLHRLVSLRTYRGKVTYLPKADNNTNTMNTQTIWQKNILQKSSNLKHSRSCTMHIDKLDYKCCCFQSAEFIPQNEFEDVISLETSMNHSFRSRCDSWLSNGSRRSFYYSIPESIYHSLADESECGFNSNTNSTDNENEFRQTFGPNPTIPPLAATLDSSEWCVEEGDFIMVHAAYQTHLGSDCFFAPKAELNDGIIYLVIIRGGISRHQLLNFLINMSTGTHLPTKNGLHIKVIPVTAFRLEPYDEHGIITVDGERVEFGALQAEVLPGVARVMVPK